MKPKQISRHFLQLLSGAVVAQFINLASYPLLARIFSPTQFGVFASFLAAAAIPSAIACGRFDIVIPTAPNYGQFAVLRLCHIISATISVLSGFALYLYWTSINASHPIVYSFTMAITVFTSGYISATSMILMRHEQFAVTSTSIIARTGITVILQICLSAIWLNPLVLVFGSCCGAVIQAILLRNHLARHILMRTIRIKQMRLMFARYKQQVLIDAPSTLLAAATLNIMPFFIQLLYGHKLVGFYAVGQRFAIMPMQLFNDSFAQIFFQKAAAAKESKGSFWPEFKLTIISAGTIALAAVICIWTFGNIIITILLGSSWEPAAEMLAILVPMLALRSVVMSIATTVFVLKRVTWLLYHNCASASVMVIAFSFAYNVNVGIYTYLKISAWLLSIEYLLFGVILARATLREHVGIRA